MIIVDLNQIMISNLMVQINGRQAVELSEDLVRHMVLNSLRAHNKKFSKDYGDMVIACDSKNVWRREFFPNYKAGRKANREKSDHDWNAIFTMLGNIRNEIRENLPYKVLELETAEADDIIAALVRRVQNRVSPNHLKKILILSGDKDFIQLHNEFVKQYNPVLNKYVGKDENPALYIKEHILKGDSSDGVPNVLSPDHTFVEGLRQRPLSKKKIEAWIKSETGMSDEVKRNYQRNHKLINLDNTPEDLQKSILDTFNEAPCGDRSKILTYFIENKLKELTDSIGDF